jgi:hypothetical protein
MKAKLGECLKKTWESKVMHGQYIRSVDSEMISEGDMVLWLSGGDLKETWCYGCQGEI